MGPSNSGRETLKIFRNHLTQQFKFGERAGRHFISQCVFSKTETVTLKV